MKMMYKFFTNHTFWKWKYKPMGFNMLSDISLGARVLSYIINSSVQIIMPVLIFQDGGSPYWIIWPIYYALIFILSGTKSHNPLQLPLVIPYYILLNIITLIFLCVFMKKYRLRDKQNIVAWIIDENDITENISIWGFIRNQNKPLFFPMWADLKEN